jgi:four helix bundle protein
MSPQSIQFLSNSKGSCGEVKSQLYVALDQRYILPAAFDGLYAAADEVGKLVNGFTAYLRESQLRGRKFQ